MPIIAQFKSNFDHLLKSSVSLVTVISMNNEKQSGDNFKAFISLLNELHRAKQIDRLTIVVSGNLHRHYISLNKSFTEEKVACLSQDIDNSWLKHNKATLHNIRFHYEIITWNKLLENKQQLKILFDNVTNDYNGKDEQFKQKVDQHSGQYYAKKLYKKLHGEIPDIKFADCQKAAINYILEECVALEKLNCEADYLVYPGKMNPCVGYIHTKYFSIRKEFIQYNEYILKTIVPKMIITTGFFSKDKSSKKAIRHHVSNETKRVLNNAEEMRVYFFLRGFNNLVSDIEKDEEKYICAHRRFSL